MITIEKILFLKRISIFQSLSSQELRMVAEVIEEEEFAAGEILFNEGQEGDCMYLVVSGKIAIYTGVPPKIKTLAEFESGDFFGEMGLYDNQPRAAAALAKEESLMLVLHKNDFCELIGEYPQVALGIMKELNQRLRETNFKLRTVEGRTIDNASKLYSREYFIECASNEVLKAKRNSSHISFLVLKIATDINTRKDSNSQPQKEEPVKDFILQAGNVFTLHQRPSDLTACFNPQKIVVMLNEATKNGTEAFKTRVQKDLNRNALSFQELHDCKIDFSFQSFTFPDDVEEKEPLIALLDQC